MSGEWAVGVEQGGCEPACLGSGGGSWGCRLEPGCLGPRGCKLGACSRGVKGAPDTWVIWGVEVESGGAGSADTWVSWEGAGVEGEAGV